jgi:glycosyltransferase involved in cell wall biosynthesis
MRILQIVPSLDPASGGPARSVPALCDALAAAGQRVTLFSTRWSVDGHKLRLDDDQMSTAYETRQFESERRWFAPHLPASTALLTALENQRGNFDVAHIHSLWNPVASLAMRACRNISLPYCLSPRGMLDPLVLKRRRLFKALWAHCLERKNVANALALHFTSVAERSAAIQSGWVLPDSILAPNVLPIAWTRAIEEQAQQQGSLGVTNAIEPPREAVSHTTEVLRTIGPQPLVLFVGRLSWVKNLPLVIAAVASLPAHVGAHLVLAGPDTESLGQPLREQAQRAGLRERVHFTGQLPHSGVRALLAHAACLVLVSGKENFGMAALEALSAGVPVVLGQGVNMDVASTSGVVERVETQPERICAALLRILLDERPRHEIQVLAREAARAVSNTEQSVARMINGYRRAVE